MLKRSQPEFYGDLVYKFKANTSDTEAPFLDLHLSKNVHRADFSDQFRKIIVCYKRIGYNINIM